MLNLYKLTFAVGHGFKYWGSKNVAASHTLSQQRRVLSTKTGNLKVTTVSPEGNWVKHSTSRYVRCFILNNK